MRGSPLLRALLAFLLIGSLAYPLWRLTSRRAAAAPPEIAHSAVAAVQLRVTFTQPPQNFRVLHLGDEIWKEAAPGAEVERKLELVYPAEGIDLQFQFVWPADAVAAARVVLTDPAGEPHERSIWGGGEVDEVLTFP